MFKFLRGKKEFKLSKSDRCMVDMAFGEMKRNADARKELGILDREIQRWHKETFDTTLGTQLLKLEEELRESVEASDDKAVEEVADVLIVCFGLRNFDSLVGNGMVNTIVDTFDYTLPDIVEAVRKKHEINKKREWYKKKDGTYRHKIKRKSTKGGVK